MVDKVTCMICGKKYHFLPSHTRQAHSLNKDKYLRRFPNAPLYSLSYRKRQSESGKNAYQKNPGLCIKRSEDRKRWHKENPGKQKELNNRPEVQQKRIEGIKCWHRENPGKQKENLNRPEVRQRNSDSQKIAQNRPEVKARSRETTLRLWQNHDYRENQIETHKILWQDPEYAKRTIEQIKKAWRDNPSLREKMSKVKKKQWQDPEYVKKLHKGLAQRPTGLEIEVMAILNSLFPSEYGYNGGYELGIVLCGKVPDFVNINGKKKLVEAYGSYWHKESDEQPRIDLFGKIGWDCLIIWDWELQDYKKLVEKLKSFHTQLSLRQPTLDLY